MRHDKINVKDDMPSLIYSILSARCPPKMLTCSGSIAQIALVDLTGPEVFDSESGRCVIITH